MSIKEILGSVKKKSSRRLGTTTHTEIPGLYIYIYYVARAADHNCVGPFLLSVASKVVLLFLLGTTRVSRKPNQICVRAFLYRQVMIGKSKSADKDGAARSAKESLAAYDAIEGPRDAGAKRKKGKGAAGKAKKITKSRTK